MRAIAFFFLASVAFAQQSNTTSGPCSPIAPNNSGTIRIDCQGVSPRLGAQLIEILNRIARNQLDADAVMAKLDEILKAINPNLPVKTYFCNGQWRTAGPSATAAMAITMGGDNTVFQEMVRLNNSRQYAELLKLCLAQIHSTPEWLSPRLFCGLAYLGTGDREKAKAMLMEFDSMTGPAYDADGCKEVSDFLHGQLR
jgi:hypothetical protein